jgi:hypothetical protein
VDDESILKTDGLGNKIWKNKEGEYHRLDGPAIEFSNGHKCHKEWWSDGKRHRLDGPAIEWANGSKQWYQNGLLHRLDGPATEAFAGTKEWWKNGKKFKNKDTFFRSLSKKEKEAALFSEDFLNG